MPFYRIMVFLKNRPNPIIGVKESTEQNIERAWQFYELKAKQAYINEFESFDLVMISKRSDSYKNWLAERTKKLENPFKGIPDVPIQYTADRKKRDYTPPSKPWWDKGDGGNEKY